MKFFIVNAAAYEPLRAAVDTAAGYPDGETQTMWNPLQVAPIAADGRVLLALPDEIATRPAVVPAVQASIAVGDTHEITEAAYRELLPPEPEAT